MRNAINALCGENSSTDLLSVKARDIYIMTTVRYRFNVDNATNVWRSYPVCRRSNSG